MKDNLIIATRESPLAMQQALWVKEKLQYHYPNLRVELRGLKTKGDKILDVALRNIGGKGLFVKELEEAILAGEADIAVHSMKDVPMVLPPDLVLPVICEREDPRDVLVSNKWESFQDLPTGGLIGTSSLRRQIQMRLLRPDMLLEDLRGNVNTRLAKLDHEDYDAIILAAAGLKRMDFGNRIAQYFSVEEMLPAAGQAALGIECREDDVETQQLISVLNDDVSATCVKSERAMCRKLNGGCQIPIAAYAELHGTEIRLRGLIGDKNSAKVLRVDVRGKKAAAEELGLEAAEKLIADGALEILREFECPSNQLKS